MKSLEELMNELELGDSNELVIERSPLEIAKAELNILEGTIVEDEENLTVLDAQRKVVEEQLMAIRKKMQEIQDRRFQLRGNIKRQQKVVQEEEHKEAERVRELAAQQERTSTFENLRQYAKELNPYWYKFAMKHQWEAAMQIALHGSVMLADEMGLGKSLTTIMAADLLKAKKVLVLTPADITLNFFDDFRLWAPHRNAVPMKSATPQVKAFMGGVIKNSEEITLVMNYETLWGRGQSNADFLKILKDANFDLMIVDEAHNAKNVKGLTFDVLTKLRSTVKNVIPLSGTFILNSPQDIWPNLHLVDPESFSDKNTFLRVYCKQNLYTQKWEFRTGGEKSLVTQLGGRIIRRTFAELAKTDVKLQLPPQYVSEYVVPMSRVSDEQLSIMTQIEAYNEIIMNKPGPDGEPVKLEIAAQIAVITRQRQAAVYPGGIKIVEYDRDDKNRKIPGTERVLFDVSEDTKESVKLDIAVERLMDMHSKGHRSVVFSQFKTGLVELESRLKEKGLRVARFDGDTKDPERQKIKKDFLRASDGHIRETYNYDVVLANFKTGGVGLTFTEATYMLLLDEEWNPGKNEQAYARINRIGQTQENYVEILRLENSIDMWMKSLNELKKSISNGFEGEVDMQASLNNYFSNGSTDVVIKDPVIIEDVEIDA